MQHSGLVLFIYLAQKALITRMKKNQLEKGMSAGLSLSAQKGRIRLFMVVL